VRYLFLEIREKQKKEKIQKYIKDKHHKFLKTLFADSNYQKSLKPKNLDPVLFEFNPAHRGLTLWYAGKK